MYWLYEVCIIDWRDVCRIRSHRQSVFDVRRLPQYFSYSPTTRLTHVTPSCFLMDSDRICGARGVNMPQR